MNPITPGINAGGGVTPWHDADYDNPVSVGPPVGVRVMIFEIFWFLPMHKHF